MPPPVPTSTTLLVPALLLLSAEPYYGRLLGPTGSLGPGASRSTHPARPGDHDQLQQYTGHALPVSGHGPIPCAYLGSLDCTVGLCLGGFDDGNAVHRQLGQVGSQLLPASLGTHASTASNLRPQLTLQGAVLPVVADSSRRQ